MIWMALLVCGAAYTGAQIVSGKSVIRVMFAIFVMAALAFPALKQPKAAVRWLFIGLPFLGMIRHMFLSGVGSARLDPLLLVTSTVAITIFISLVLSEQMDFSGTPLAFLVFCMMFVGLVQVLNPGQGGTFTQSMLVGLTGIMINLVPILFFFIARSIADTQFVHSIIRSVFWVGFAAALYGMKQVYFGFFGFERAFVEQQGYTSLQVSGTTRPFSIFNNSAEYASYIHIAVIIAVAMLLYSRGKRSFVLPLVVGAVFFAGFLTGSRGFTVKAIAGVVILVASKVKNRAAAGGVVLVLVAGIAMWSASTTTTGRIQDKEVGASQLIEQQFQALRDPFNRNVSTLPIHWDQASEGILYAIKNEPLGLGTGVPTRGGSKFGGLQAGTELDIGDAFLAWGIVGGVLYLMVIGRAVWQASKVRQSLPGALWVGMWAAIATSVGVWLVGGNYAVPPLVWFMIGAVDGAYKRLRSQRLLDGTLPV